MLLGVVMYRQWRQASLPSKKTQPQSPESPAEMAADEQLPVKIFNPSDLTAKTPSIMPTALLPKSVPETPRESETQTMDKPLLTPDDAYLFNEGTHERLYQKLGAQVTVQNGQQGVHFAVWAPNAQAVSVIGDFNHWQAGVHTLHSSASGVWQGFVEGLDSGTSYKYAIDNNGEQHEKADPLAFYAERRPKTASLVWNNQQYQWADDNWMTKRAEAHRREAPVSIYELHLASWRRNPQEGNRWLTYRELAEELPEYVKTMGFTHVELMPIMEHPFDGSWGYQVTGYFAPTSRFGTPDDFKYLIDKLHQAGIGVILDWVPAHFPCDGHGLGRFDGTHLYEHADPREGFHPDWQTYIFNYGRNEVQSFLLSNALYWLDEFHVDGLRVDAVASMLYRDYSRENTDWLPNQFGGRENLEAVALLKRINERVYANYPDVIMIAEESTAWPGVSQPTYNGGLGFGYKWDMGWMHDTLKYLEKDPVHRRHHHNQITFRMVYAFTENYMLPLSHDEVVHGKGSLLAKMPGDDWQKFANLRLLFSYMFTQPGKKLLFMGSELAMWDEWSHEDSLPWHFADYDRHQGVQQLIKDLNQLYTSTPALHAQDCSHEGFRWLEGNDGDNSVLTYARLDGHGNTVFVAVNFTPVVREGYRLGVGEGNWVEALNSDATQYGGSGVVNDNTYTAEPTPWQGQPASIQITLPPLGSVMFKAN